MAVAWMELKSKNEQSNFCIIMCLNRAKTTKRSRISWRFYGKSQACSETKYTNNCDALSELLFRRCIALSLGRLPNYYTPHCVVPEIFFCQGEGHLESMREEGSGAVISLGRRLTLRFCECVGRGCTVNIFSFSYSQNRKKRVITAFLRLSKLKHCIL